MSCFLHNLSISTPAFVSTFPLATHSTCCCWQSLSLRGALEKELFFCFSYLLAYNFVFMELLKSFTISPSAFRFPEYCCCCFLSFSLCPCGFVSFTSSFIEALEECEEGAGIIIHICTHQLYPFFHLEKCFDWFDEHVG